jgi:hypothetical protein
VVRFQIDEPNYEASLAELRNAMDDKDFESAGAGGAALSADEAIAYAQRGHGERKRPASGWASLTPTKRDVVRLVSEGLAKPPLAVVNTRPVARHRVPAVKRSSSCLVRCPRRMLTPSGSGMGNTATETSVFTWSSRSSPSTRFPRTDHSFTAVRRRPRRSAHWIDVYVRRDCQRHCHRCGRYCWSLRMCA